MHLSWEEQGPPPSFAPNDVEIRVVLATWTLLLRGLLRTHFENNLHQVNVVGMASNGYEAVELCRDLQPHILILEHPLGRATAATLAALHEVAPTVRALIVARTATGLGSVLGKGAGGCVAGADDSATLSTAVQVIARGGVFISPGAQNDARNDVFGSFSDRQNEILRLIVAGRSTKEVATTLGISVKTADHHRARLMQKLGVHSVVDLVRHAVRHGLAGLEEPSSSGVSSAG